MRIDDMMYKLSWFCISFGLISISIIILLFSGDRIIIFLGGMVFILYLIEIIDLFKEVKND